MHPAKKMILEGKTSNEIQDALGITKVTISFHRKSLGLGTSLSRHDWNKVTKYASEVGYELSDINAKFNIPKSTILKAIKTGLLKVDRYKRYQDDLEGFLIHVINRKLNNREKLLIKSLLVKEGHITDGCQECGIVDWRGKPLTLQLEHVDGNPYHNRIGNYSILCPNCHSQTATWGNKKRL